MRGVRTVVISCLLCAIAFLHGTDGGEYPDWVKEALDELDIAVAELGVKFPQRPNLGLPGTTRMPEPATPQPPPQPETRPPPKKIPVTFGGDEIEDPSCPPSMSTKNGKKVKCRGEVIFHEDFTDPRINKNYWNYQIYLPNDGFMVLRDTNAEISDGKLRITPTVNSYKATERDKIDLGPKCTFAINGNSQREECSNVPRFAYINPPVSSARLHSHGLSFKYGTVEIRARLPVGDWIVPHIFLESKDQFYGSSHSESGRIALMKTRGNRILISESEDISNKALQAVVHVDGKARRMPTQINPQGWGNSFHNYTMKWTPDSLTFYVDEKEIGKDVVREGIPYYKVMGLQNGQKEKYENRPLLAPFDKEFYLAIGVDVGGLDTQDFPDECKNGDNLRKKPWHSGDVKPYFSFWKKREVWWNTWIDGKEALEIDYIKITAL